MAGRPVRQVNHEGGGPDGMRWQDALREEFDSGRLFRFDQPAVAVSSIAEQYYCEAKVEQEFVHGEVPTEAKDVGTDLHEQVLAMEKVELKELVERIEKSPRTTASFGLHGAVLDLDVVGIPDAVVFERGSPRWVIELKTTLGDPNQLWDDQLVQVRVYGLLLERMGFDCSRLELALVRWRQEDISGSAVKEKALSRITDSLFEGRSAALEAELGMKFFLFPHDPLKAERAVAWAQGYWLSKRDAVPAASVGKCRACEYNAVCPFSLTKTPGHRGPPSANPSSSRTLGAGPALRGGQGRQP